MGRVLSPKSLLLRFHTSDLQNRVLQRSTYSFFCLRLRLFSTPSASFAANRGADYTSVFDRSFTAFMSENGTFDLLFDIAPFNYNPAAGDLLLEVLLKTPTTTAAPNLQFEFANNSSNTSRVFELPGPLMEVQNSGLLTRFTVTEAPEACTGAMTVGGMLLLLALKRTKSAKKSLRACVNLD